MKYEKKRDILSIENVDFSFGNKNVLSAINLHFKKSEIVGIFGRNGSGKTTLLNGLAGQLFPKTGSINTSGIKVTLLPDFFFLWGKLRVREIINFFYLSNQNEEWLKYLESNLNIEIFYNRFFDSLSFGQKKRVQLFFCLMNKPDFIILDEPFTGLDFIQKSKIINFIKSLKKELGVILSVHEFEMMDELYDRALILKDQNVFELNHRSISEIRHMI
jgi:ABC-type multidrug transport system ATPase subunit